jgi:hypothetical protein
MYDIFFISCGELNAENNWNRVKSRFPTAKRIKDVQGIHQAHMLAAKRSFTPMFWVVDGDAEVLDTFNFDYEVWEGDYDIVHVWRSRNPINGLEYGYGGIKLLPKKLTLELDDTKPDMTTSIGSRFKPMPEISNITAFNTDGFSTYRSGFRECAKLASKVIQGQVDAETEERLSVWCTLQENVPYGAQAMWGATQGKQYGLENQNNPSELLKINNYTWLREKYENFTKMVKDSTTVVSETSTN